MKICSVPLCGKRTIARGWCSTHYSRWFQNGTLIPKKDLTLTVEERFWAFVKKSTGCWIWTGSKSKNGYGHFLVKRRLEKAHRVSWEIHNGPIPSGLWVLHKCDVKDCVNPSHLFIGNRLDNVRDMIKKGRDARGERASTAKLTEEQVKEILSIGHSAPFTHTGKQFGVTGCHISWIVRGKGWKHISRP